MSTLSGQGLSGVHLLQHSRLVALSTWFLPSKPRLRFTFVSSRGWGCGDLEQSHGGAEGQGKGAVGHGSGGQSRAGRRGGIWCVVLPVVSGAQHGPCS